MKALRSFRSYHFKWHQVNYDPKDPPIWFKRHNFNCDLIIQFLEIFNHILYIYPYITSYNLHQSSAGLFSLQEPPHRRASEGSPWTTIASEAWRSEFDKKSGFHQRGSPIAGWFKLDNPKIKWMITRGTPWYLRKPPYIFDMFHMGDDLPHVTGTIDFGVFTLAA